MEEKMCKICGMTLENEEDYGTDEDGNKNENYCRHCYLDGHFAEEEE